MFLGHKIEIFKTILVRANELNFDFFLVDKILITESDGSVIFICKLTNYLYDKHFDAFEIFNSGKNYLLHLNEL